MTWLTTLFWNPTERRLRAGWRVFIHFVLWIYVPALLNALLRDRLVALLAPATSWTPQLLDRLVFFTLTCVGVLITTWWVVRVIDRRAWRDLGLHLTGAWWRDCAFGLALGAFLMTLVFLVQWAAGWVQVTGVFQVTVDESSPFIAAILAPLLAFVVIGVTEEILARGYQLRNLAEGLAPPLLRPRGAIAAAWLISSLLFGLLHIFNPNSTFISTQNLVLAGLFFGLGYVLTGSLAIPIGLHISWNFVQGNVFGFPVSGRTYPGATFLAIEQRGPEFWTGGAFGPEAGLLGIVAILLGCVLTAWWVQWHYGRLDLQLSLTRYRAKPAHATVPSFHRAAPES